jgi:uncharacterized protein YcfJ
MKKITLLSIAAVFAINTFAADYSESESIKVKVIRSEAIHGTVQVVNKVERCQDVKTPINQGTSGSEIVGTGLGALVGGVLGHQIGGGTGKKIATIGGVALGAYTGNKMTQTEDTSNNSYTITKQCSTVDEYRDQDVITGYRNYGMFRGHEIISISQSPTSEISVTATYSY